MPGIIFSRADAVKLASRRDKAFVNIDCDEGDWR